MYAEISYHTQYIFFLIPFDFYLGGTVYKWQIESGNLNNVLGSLTYSAHLGTTDLDDKDFKWAAHRQGSSVERHFYLGNDEFLLRSSQVFIAVDILPVRFVMMFFCHGKERDI